MFPGPDVMRAPVLKVRGWVGACRRSLTVQAEERGAVICVADVGTFLATPGATATLALEPDVSAEELAEVVDGGPVRIYALALGGVWSLHAAAAAPAGLEGAVAFLGESGYGKSTLARHLGCETGGAWRQVADDILPVDLAGDGLVAHPHFPQLKLAPDEQPWLGLPRRISLRAVYVIAAQEPDRREVAVNVLSQQEAALALVRHTVAARLFDRGLLAAHLAFAAEAAQRIPVRRLRYPHDYKMLPQVAAAVEADLAALP